MKDIPVSPYDPDSIGETPNAPLPSNKKDESKEVTEGEEFFTQIGVALACKIGEFSYLIEGFKRVDLGFKINLKIVSGDGRVIHQDSLGLSSDQRRKQFAKNCQDYESWEEIPKHLLIISEQLTSWHDSNHLEVGEEIEPMSPEDEKEAQEFLRDPALMERIREDLASLGCVGEENNQLIVYLAATSRKLGLSKISKAKPLILTVQGESSVGKSFLVKAISKLIPPEELVDLSSLSEKALVYMPRDSLKFKLLIIAEAVGGQAADYYFRTLISEGMIRHAVTVQNPDTGQFETKIVEMDGPIALFQTTTSIDINPENRTRLIEIRPDDSQRQTERIHAQQKFERTSDGRAFVEDQGRIIRLHRNAQRLLQAKDIIIPYAPHISFASPKNQLRVRRDLSKFLDLISVIALLRQFQKSETGDKEDGNCLDADILDYSIAYDLAVEIFQTTLDDINPKSRELLNIINEHKVKECSFTRKSIREWSGWPESTVRKFVLPLEEEGYLEIKSGGTGGKPIEYEPEVDKREPVKTGLLAPDELSDKIENSGSDDLVPF